MQAARDRQKSYADLKRKPMEFQVGDKVMLFCLGRGSFFIIAVQTPGSRISILLAVGTPFTSSGKLYCQWELSPGSGNALCILFPTKVISYASRQLKIYEKNYTTHDLELGA
nr:putative reverse transcriptase domain-containing protein [Tanacetum cinerariifolium]